MSKRLLTVLGATALFLSFAVVATAQVQTTTVTKVQTIQNPDGTYTIVEYPIGKETIVTLNPIDLKGALGTATILRDPNLTTIKLNLSNLPADVAAINVFAVDPTGAVTLLGPVDVTNGIGTFTTTTPLSRFMLIASSGAALAAYNANTHILFRSAVPPGLTVIPLTNAAGEQVGVATVETPVSNVETIQNPEGTYTIVEYPVGKQTVVTLNPVGLTGATGRATILRDPTGTTIKLNLTSLPSDVTSMNVYAVDQTGALTFLGPIQITNGVGTFKTTTPLSRFMLIASPEANLTTYNTTTRILFRSAVPPGFAVIPLGKNTAVGEQLAGASTLSDYAVPMLGIPAFKRGDNTKLKVNFTGVMEGARANIFIHPRKRGNATQIRMRFHDLKQAPKGQAYILWAVSPDNQFQRLGEIVNVRGRNEAEIRSETSFNDFGLLLTTEDVGVTKGTIIRPSGNRVGVIEIIR